MSRVIWMDLDAVRTHQAFRVRGVSADFWACEKRFDGGRLVHRNSSAEASSAFVWMPKKKRVQVRVEV